MRKTFLTIFLCIMIYGFVMNAPWMILLGVLGASIVAPMIWFDA